MWRAAVLATALSCLGFPLFAHALAVTGFEPRDVTIGTRLTIRGDFAELTAARSQPKVQGRRFDTSKTVQFQVLAYSRRTIIARVRDVPSTKWDPAAGKTWSLVVRSAAGDIAEADDLFTTPGPTLVTVTAREVVPGGGLTLYAIDPGTKPPTVVIGRKKAKVLRNAPAGESRDDDPWRVQLRVPRLRNGFYALRLENSLGRAPGSVPMLVYGGDVAGLVPYASASLQGRPALDAPLCSWSGHGDRIRVSACAGDPCARELALELVPDGSGGWTPADVVVTYAAASGGAPEVLESVSAQAKLLPAPSPELLAGAFVAWLRPVAEPGAPPLFVRGYFQALPGD